VTAKQELLQIVERLSEEAAERVLEVAKTEANGEHRRGDPLVLANLLRRWREESGDVTDEEIREYDEMLATMERVRFRTADEW
jgi:hypothetical protein